MASTVLDPVADEIVAELAALAVTPTVKGYLWAPASLDNVPAGVVDVPSVRRVDPESAESEVGSNDWYIDYPVTLYFDLSEAAYSQAQAVEVVEAFIKAIDADPSLGGTVLDAKVVEAEPEIVVDDARPLLAYRCTLSTLKLVS